MSPRVVSILTVLQLFVVFLGVCVTGALLRLYATHFPGAPFPSFPRLMRTYGFGLAILPLGWAVASTLSIRSLDSTPAAGLLYRIFGYLLFALLVIVFSVSVLIAFHAATYTGIKPMK